jgi:hypothetical protein
MSARPSLSRRVFALALGATAPLAAQRAANGMSLGAQSIPAWHLVREVSFGQTGDAASELSDIRGVEISKNGNLLVLDYKAENIRVFSPDGKFVRTIGRSGEGPGEFRQPNGFARSPDGNIWVNDPANNRFTVLRDDGQYVRDVHSELHSFGYIWSAFFDATGRMVNSISIRSAAAPAPKGLDYSASYHEMLERRSLVSNRADTILPPSCVPAGATVHQWSGQGGGGGMIMSVPYSASQSRVYSSHDFAWCAFGNAYTIYRIGLDHGDTLQAIHGNATPVPVTAAERDSAVANARAAFAKNHLDASAISVGDVPRIRPIVIGLALDDQGRLWVRLTPAITGHTRYDVYNARGVEVGSVDLPVVISQGPNVIIRGNKLYGVVLDADDVPAVVRFRIEPALTTH